MPLDILKSYHKTELTTSVTFSVDGVTNSIKLHLEEETVTTEIQTSLEKTSTSNPFLCAADFFLQLGSCKEAVR